MKSFSPNHLILIIAIVVIGLGLIFKGVGVTSSLQEAQPGTSNIQYIPGNALAVDTKEISKRADDIPPPITRT